MGNSPLVPVLGNACGMCTEFCELWIRSLYAQCTVSNNTQSKHWLCIFLGLEVGLGALHIYKSAVVLVGFLLEHPI
jgi:hypothetical protein